MQFSEKPLLLIEALFMRENRACPLPVLTTSPPQLPLKGPSSLIIKTSALPPGELPEVSTRTLGQAVNSPGFCNKALGSFLYSPLGPGERPVRVRRTAQPKSGQFVFE